MPIVMDNGARASVSLPLAVLSLPLPVSWRASPWRHEPGAGSSDGQAWHLNPCPAVASGRLCGGDGGVWGGAQRGPSEHRERETGVRTEAHPVPRCTHTHTHSLPSVASPLQKSYCGGGPIVHRPTAEEKGPLVVNNSAVHSDHNGGTSHCFEHLFRVGTGPLATRHAADRKYPVSD